jgi:hypothetical protein
VIVALFGLTCGGGNALTAGAPDAAPDGATDAGACISPPDAEVTCGDLCADLDEFRRFPCDKPPYALCNSQGEPVRPLNRAQEDYVVTKCRTCSGCSRNCQSCSAGLPSF